MMCDFEDCPAESLYTVNRWHLDLWRAGYCVCEIHKKEIVDFIERNHDRAVVRKKDSGT